MSSLWHKVLIWWYHPHLTLSDAWWGLYGALRRRLLNRLQLTHSEQGQPVVPSSRSPTTNPRKP